MGLSFDFPALREVLAAVRQQFPGIEEIDPTAPRDLVQEIYELLIGAPADELPALIETFSTAQRTAAVHAYLLGRDEDERDHLAHALTSRPKPEFVLPGWIVLQDEIHDSLFRHCLREVARKVKAATSPAGLGAVQLALNLLSSDSLENEVLSELFQSPAPIDPWLRGYGNAIVRLRQGAPLYDHLKGEALMTGPGAFLVQQSLQGMLEWAKAATDENRQRFGANYLSRLSLDVAERRAIEYLVRRYGLPAQGHAFWSRLHKTIRDAIQDMMAEKMLSDFFEGIADPHQRFQFWKEFMRNLHDIQGSSDRRQAILVFPNFFVVEFRDVGNAAYFYRHEYLPRFKPRINGPASTLKDRRLVSDRLKHYTGWQDTWRQSVRQFISRGMPH